MTHSDRSAGREFLLPDIGEGLEEAEIIAWLVSPGDTVARDQPLVEVLTDKAQVELPSPYAGVIASLGPAVGDVVKVGTVLVTFGEAAAVSSSASAAVAAVATAPAPPASPSPAAVVGSGRAKASPSTRRRAAQLGIDLGSIAGTGPGGRVLADDLVAPAAPLASLVAPTAPPAFLAPPSAVPAPSAPAPTSGLGRAAFGVQPLRGIRRATARAMAQAWSEIPHITGMDEIDATPLLEARRRLKAAAGPRGEALTPLALLALAAVRSLRRYPLVNASIDVVGETVTVHERINLGVAVATEDGLIVPVVADADRYGVLGLAEAIAALASAARSKSLKPDQLRGGTFTLTNYGSLGGRFATPIVRPGEVGILGFGAIKERPLVVDGTVVARPALPVVFSADHRLIDGDLSTAFQEHVLGLLSDPLTLLLEG